MSENKKTSSHDDEKSGLQIVTHLDTTNQVKNSSSTTSAVHLMQMATLKNAVSPAMRSLMKEVSLAERSTATYFKQLDALKKLMPPSMGSLMKEVSLPKRSTATYFKQLDALKKLMPPSMGSLMKEASLAERSTATHFKQLDTLKKSMTPAMRSLMKEASLTEKSNGAHLSLIWATVPTNFNESILQEVFECHGESNGISNEDVSLAHEILQGLFRSRDRCESLLSELLSAIKSQRSDPVKKILSTIAIVLTDLCISSGPVKFGVLCV